MRALPAYMSLLNVFFAVGLLLYHSFGFAHGYSSTTVRLANMVPGAEPGSALYEELRISAMNAAEQGATGFLPLLGVVLCNTIAFALLAWRYRRTTKETTS